MAPIIDCHVHVFPDRLQKIAPSLSRGPVDQLRKRARAWMRPVSASLHRTQTLLRLFPAPLRSALDGLGAIAPLPGLLVESTLPDLRETMLDAGVDYSVVIAHPPWIPNEFLLEVAKDDPRMLPVVFVPSGTAKPADTLRKYVKKGARAVKIHPAADGEGPDSARYRTLLKTAAELGIPVILHTGCIQSHLFYKDPEQGRVERFEMWFRENPELRFVLAHMNFHEPGVALDLAERYPNLWVDTSWQPPEVIGEAARRIGASRVLFGSDWPFVGNNLSVGIDRIRDCVDTGVLGEADAEAILGTNAAALFEVRDAR